MTVLSRTQQEVLDLLSSLPYLDIRSNGRSAYIYDNRHYHQDNFPIKISTFKALLKGQKITKHSADILTGYTVYRLYYP